MHQFASGIAMWEPTKRDFCRSISPISARWVSTLAGLTDRSAHQASDAQASSLAFGGKDALSVKGHTTFVPEASHDTGVTL